MQFTGERFIPGESGKIRLEHYHRYAVVLDCLSGKDILDVACGEGYGASFMAKLAHSVVGVDISIEAVQHASLTYQSENLRFQQGSALALPFNDTTFDIVVSFETIEHLAEQEEMLSEIKRVLRPDGVLIISSPNRPIYTEESGEHNEFHVKELDFLELETLLAAKFPSISFYGQRILMGSVIQPIDGAGDSYRAWHDNGLLQQGTAKLNDPVYFLAVCGAQSVILPRLATSVVFPEALDLVKHYVGFAKWANTLDATLAERDGQIASLSQAVTERNGQIASLSQAVTERNGQIASLSQAVTERNGQIGSLTDQYVRRGEWALRLDRELRETQTMLLAITQSNSWQLTKPLREARRWVTQPGDQALRYVRAGLRLMKRGYQALPLSQQTKARHRSLLAGVSPKLLLLSGSYPATIPALSAPVNGLLPSGLDQCKNQQNAAVAIFLPTSVNPIVSVIIPVFGKIEYTLLCLDSIAKSPPEAPFEVIVVDDCSPDSSVDLLRQVQGIRLIQNDQNQGFIRSCNFGAQAAKGEYLHFLNNDTQVTPGWLDELLRTFQEFPGTGLAGSKLVYPDGRLQEAGGIIWQDGSAWNFGRFQDPSLPVFNYAREVDYCSGASITVPKSLFFELGGFDEHYLPAYCEDSDLALKIRDKGYRVIYQPLSTVVHFEGITSGTDTTQGVKAYQVENTNKLFERWHQRLKLHQAPGTDVDNAKDRRAKRRVLVLDHCTPTPDQDSGSIDAYNHMLLLREMDFQVTFIPEDNFSYVPDYTTALQRAGIEMLYAPYVTGVKQHLEEYGDRYDLVFISRPGAFERNISVIRKYCPKTKVLFHTVDLHFLRMLREAELLQSSKARKKGIEMKRRELAFMSSADMTTVLSTEEIILVQQALPNANVRLLPYSRNIAGTNKSFQERSDIVFVGGYQHTPNVDAVQFFVAEIMPLLRKQLPGVRFHVVGSGPPEEIQRLAAEDVIITGFVEDLNSLLDRMRVSVAPLRYGAGIKGKIGTAMAVGLPVVGTSLAAEGMSLTNGENILVADGAEAFANATIRLYKDEALWGTLSKAGLEFADRAWGAEAAWRILANILADIGITSERGSNDLSLYVGDVKIPAHVAENSHLKSPAAPEGGEYVQRIQQEVS